MTIKYLFRSLCSALTVLIFTCTCYAKENITTIENKKLDTYLKDLNTKKNINHAINTINHLIKKNKTINKDILYFQLAKLYLNSSKYKKCFNTLKKIENNALATSLHTAHHFYHNVPGALQLKHISLLHEKNFFDDYKYATCPYYTQKQRKRRASLIYDMVKTHTLNQNIRNKIFYELYVLAPEVISVKQLKKIKGFYIYLNKLAPKKFIKRMHNLMIFGKNKEARATYVKVANIKKSIPQPIQCELDYQNAKLERKMRNYTKARKKMQQVYKRCNGEAKIKARFMDLYLATIMSDYSTIKEKRFEQFVNDFSSHSFCDDVLLFKARMQLDKKDNYNAHKTLDKIIHDFPNGDMIERALFLKAFDYAKQHKLQKANALLKKLRNISAPNTFEHAQAIYWQARLMIFKDVFSLDNPDTSKKLAIRALKELAHTKTPTHYSLLSISLLKKLNEDITFTTIKKEASQPSKTLNTSPHIKMIAQFIKNGFIEDAKTLIREFSFGAKNDDAIKLALMAIKLEEPSLVHHALIRCNKKTADQLMKSRFNLYKKIAYPSAYEKKIDKATKNFDLKKPLIMGIIREESGFIATSKSWAQARGLMQLMLPSAKHSAYKLKLKNFNKKQLYDPLINITLGVNLLHSYKHRFDHIVLGLAAYNAGPGNVSRWLDNKILPIDTFIEEIPFKETRHYIAQVLKSAIYYANKNKLMKDMVLENMTLSMKK